MRACAHMFVCVCVYVACVLAQASKRLRLDICARVCVRGDTRLWAAMEQQKLEASLIAERDSMNQAIMQHRKASPLDTTPCCLCVCEGVSGEFAGVCVRVSLCANECM